MTISTAQLVRSRLNDPVRWDNETQYGDGLSSAFKLRQGAPYSTLSAGSVTAAITVGGTAWSATGGTFDVTGGIATFSGIISANTAVKFDYAWSVFSDDELSYFTAQGGIPEATLMGVNFLLVNYAKRGSWAAPDGTNYNDTQALNSLMSMRSALVSEIRGDEQGPAGGFVNWPIEQENF